MRCLAPHDPTPVLVADDHPPFREALEFAGARAKPGAGRADPLDQGRREEMRGRLNLSEVTAEAGLRDGKCDMPERRLVCTWRNR